MWANIDNNRGQWEQLILKGKSSYQPGYQMEVNSSSNVLYFGINDGSYSEWGVSTSIPFTLDTWTYFVGVVDRTTNYSRAYKDGVQVDTSSISGVGSIDVSDNLTIGEGTWGWPDARIEEVRISNTARSAGWIQTEYNNQTNPDFFYSMSNVSCGGNLGFNFSYCKKLTVESDLVSADLDDFPLLINITDKNLESETYGGLVGSDEGYDIIFKSSNCATLDHEIEKYDKETGELVAWVRIPTLSGSEDTEIYMYFGNSLIDCPTENPEAVWDSNYQAVYHLKEDPEQDAKAYDSTSNDNDGTFTGGMISGDQVTGQINGALEFDGNSEYINLGNFMSSGVSEVTLEAWVDKTDSDDTRVVSKSDGTNATGTQHKLTLRLSGSSPTISARMNTVNNVGVDLVSADSVPNDTLMHHVAWTYDGSAVKFYVDGAPSNCQLGGNGGAGNSCSPTGNIINSNRAIVIGNNDDIPNSRFFGGIIDEVRISNIARDAAWMETQYNNHNNPNFIRVGSCFEQTMTQTNAWEEEYQ
jgi:hypothetical protein